MNPFISYIVIGLLCFNGVRLENSAQPRIRLTTPSSAVCKDVAKNCKENLHMCAEPKNQDDKLAQKNHKRMLEQCNKSCFQCRSTCEDRETDKCEKWSSRFCETNVYSNVEKCFYCGTTCTKKGLKCNCS